MSNETQAPIKPKAPEGTVTAPTATLSGKGILWTNDVVTLPGSEKADKIAGAGHDDLVLSGGAKAPEGERETIDGKAGFDVAVLKGQREDYVVKLPSAAEYPTITAPDWEKPETNTLFGKSVILEHVETHEVIQLRNVEAVVFDNGKNFDSPKASLTQLPEMLKKGDVSAETTQNLVLQAKADLDSGELYLAQIAATREAAQAIAKDYKIGMGVEAYQALSDKVVDDLANSQIKVSDRIAPAADVPKSEYMEQQVAANMPKPK